MVSKLSARTNLTNSTTRTFLAEIFSPIIFKEGLDLHLRVSQLAEVVVGAEKYKLSIADAHEVVKPRSASNMSVFDH